MQFNKRSGHIDVYLQNYSRKLANPALIGRDAFPALPVDKETDRYMIHSNDAFAQITNTIVEVGAETRGTESTFTSGRYECIQYGAHTMIYDEVIENCDDPRSYERTQQQDVMKRLQLAEERRIKDTFFVSGTYANRWISSSTTQWSDQASTPIEDIISAKTVVADTIGRDPNTLIIGYAVYQDLLKHHDLLDRVRGGATNSNPALINQQLMAEVFEVERFFVGRSIYNTSARGLTESLQRVWGKDALVAYIDPSPSLYSQTLGFLPRVRDYTTDRWYDQPHRGDVIRTLYKQDELLTLSGAGVFIGNAVA